MAGIVGNVDFASVAIWGFWVFFALLVFYLQTENMREGYPLEDDAGEPSANQGPFPVPSPKTFKLNHGRGEVMVPGPDRQRRTDLDPKHGKMKQVWDYPGQPYEATGDAMIDGVGPAAWANRQDVPELDGKGHPKIVPMAGLDGFAVSAGRDPRGMPVMSGDGHVVGEITDMWLDEPEQLVRYLEYKLTGDHGSGTRLVPIQLAKIQSDKVAIRSIYASHFANVPSLKSKTQVTLLEEDKICAYYGGGKLYADASRLEAQI
ncbi:MAG: photosynthetic reaction center subunit H [Pseudomonadota bacterium]